ncbi:MAG: hydantoinase B/oxoprolinase family protein [Hyphomicrobiaceae bacterium]
MMDPIRIGLIWRRIEGLVDQVAETFLRAAFSVVVRDNYDMAFSLFDARGHLIAQSKRSIPSFTGTLPRTLEEVLAKFRPEQLAPGDVVITNDPWIGTGHLNDISMVHPIHRDGRLIAFAASTAHTVDIGGAPSPTARDRFEEGLCIPICRIVEAGRENPVVIDFLKENLRMSDETLGDIRAQFAAYADCKSKLFGLLDDEGLADLEAVADDIIERSEEGMRRAISALPDGSWRDEFDTDGFDESLHIACSVTITGDEMTIDFAGTSPQIPWPVNCVLNYTQAYARYAVKCLLDPEAPNNAGSLRPITVTAPEGCLLNATPPVPVWGRHLSGHYVPPAVIGALSQVVPERAVAESGSPLWNVYFSGARPDGSGNFVKMYFMNGGHGARAIGDGPGCLSFPSNVSNEPTEVFENQTPMLIAEKSFVTDTGGAGRYRGGNAQRIRFRSLSKAPLTMTIRHERIRFPPRGLLGGLNGTPGIDQLNGEPLAAKSRTVLAQGDEVMFQTPGGGGLFPASERAKEQIDDDIASGLVTQNAAAKDYGVDK